MRKLFLLPVLLLILQATPALSLSDSPYLAPGAFDAVNLLPPPPEPNSTEQKRDVERGLQTQQTSTAAGIRRRCPDSPARPDAAGNHHCTRDSRAKHRAAWPGFPLPPRRADAGIFLFLPQRPFDLWGHHWNSARQYGARETPRALCARLGLRREPRGRWCPF